METKVEEKISDELDYDIEVSQHSNLQYNVLYPQNGSTITLNNGAGQVLAPAIVIPARVENLNKSSLAYQMQFGAQGATAYTYINANTLTSIFKLQFFDQYSGQTICDINNFGTTMAVLAPICTKFDKFLSKSLCNSFTVPPLSSTLTLTTGVQSVPICPATASTLSSPYPVEDICRFNEQPLYNVTGVTTATLFVYTAPSNFVGFCNGSAAGGTTTATSVDMFLQNSYTSQRQYYISNVTNQACYLDVNIPFSAFKFTALAIDKLIYSPTNLQLNVWFNGTDQFAFSSGSNTDPGNGATGSVTLTGTSQINNLRVISATEINPDLQHLITQKVLKQTLVMEIPYITTLRIPLSAQTNHNFQVSLTTAYGNSLLYMITSPMATTVNGASAFLANVRSRGLVTFFNTKINGVPIANPQGYTVTNGDDYMIQNRKFLQDSVVQTLGEYVLANWCNIDSWAGTKPLHELQEESDIASGRPLSGQNLTWNFESLLSASATLTWQIIIIGQKTWTLSNSGSIVA